MLKPLAGKGNVRKFRSLGGRRHVLLSARHLFAALVVLVSLEFLPHRSHNAVEIR
jgi:hypothetical protein